MTQDQLRTRQTREPDRNPQYIILFSSDSMSEKEYKPILEFDDLISVTQQNVSYGYGFDRNLIPIIPALWYCLHLPRTHYDLRSVPIHVIKTSQNWELGQDILLIPVPYPKDIHSMINPYNPSIVIYPDDIFDAAHEFCRDVPMLLDMAPLSSLNSQLLNKHWLQLHGALSKREDELLSIPPLFPESLMRTYILPTFFVMRQLSDSVILKNLAELRSKIDAFTYSFKTQAILSAAAQFRVEGITDPTPAQFEDYVSEEKRNFKCPVSVCIPGVSPRSAARFIEGLSKDTPTKGTHKAAEMSVLSFLVSHRALARNGYAVLSQELQDEAFHNLAQLETMWSDATMLQPSKINRITGAISKSVKNVLDDREELAILHGSSLTAFSEFPIGLATLGTDTSPLVCRMPVAYRPLVPLTRALQFELSSPSFRYLGDELRVIVIECIPTDEAVGKMSREGWQVAKETTTQSDRIQWVFSEASSLKELRAVLAEHKSDILVLSAHGHFDRKSNCSGFICGNELILDQELGELPPVTILSSCQIWPRGSGTVSVADVMVRQGAVAIIGTLIPINVRRNALLMTRFFVNIVATLKGEFPMRTIEDVWHYTVTSNAVNDILDGNMSLSNWAHEGDYEQTVIYEFMQRRSAGRLRKSHIYKDSEEILLEIARERGIESTFRAWMRFPGYIPESVFYSVIGWPERIVLYDPLIKGAIDANKTPV